jgi:two-component system NarL family sensor kinase
MIGVANRPGPYLDEHERLTSTYAAMVAVAVRNAQLNEALRESHARLERQVSDRTAELALARDSFADKAERLKSVLAETVDTQEQERRRIASDIHDGINQLLIGAILELTSGQHRLASGQVSSAQEALSSARHILTQVEAEIRRVVHDLHPPVLEGLGLAPALRELAERFERFTGIDTRFQVSGEPRRLGDRAEIGLYRVAQEALRNVAVHSGAQTVAVTLAFRAGHVVMEMGDDGGGFDPSVVSRSGDRGFGLESMRRRVRDLGGDWAIDSVAGKGTRLEARIPTS